MWLRTGHDERPALEGVLTTTKEIDAPPPYLSPSASQHAQQQLHNLKLHLFVSCTPGGRYDRDKLRSIEGNKHKLSDGR